MVPPALAQKTDDSTQKEFARLTAQYFAAYGKLQAETMAPFFAKEPELVFYDLAPMKFVGWAEYEKALHELLGRYESLQILAKDDLRATRHGNVVWVTTTFHLAGKKKDGKSVVIDGRHTAIWEKRGEKWLIVHEHWSKPA